MLRVFNQEITRPDNYVVTLELVPGRESTGRSIDTITGIARDAFDDGRISAVSITDNPGGNPSLSPDVLGFEIFRYGMDVIVHFTCRDMNRVGMESRALQLARMGMKNILALTGDYAGKGFGGQGAPVFDLDSVILTRMLQALSNRLADSGDPDGFFSGCAVSPFKTTESETCAQYRKLDKKLASGASFIITQLGYDIEKFRELMHYRDKAGITTPIMASVYLLSPRSARAMNRGRVPGAMVPDPLYNSVAREWTTPREGLNVAIDRAARLGVILKKMGYSGIHLGGVHRSFDTVGAILDRMDDLEKSGEYGQEEFARLVPASGFYLHRASQDRQGTRSSSAKELATDIAPYRLLKSFHHLFFNKNGFAAPACRGFASFLDRNGLTWLLKLVLEDPAKKLLLSCQRCGDCAIQHTAFLCPESGCPKHTRNGPCGGSRDGTCEVNPERLCVWVRAYRRLAHFGEEKKLAEDFVPPRLWELNKSSSWINFHLDRDHQR